MPHRVSALTPPHQWRVRTMRLDPGEALRKTRGSVALAAGGGALTPCGGIASTGNEEATPTGLVSRAVRT